MSDLKEDDLVVAVISGGGSTLLCQPKNFTCHKEKEIIECLFEKGAGIEEINTLRKHISLARGGFLAKYAYPARVLAMIFSDVPGNNLELIASGPTVKDSTTIQDAAKIIKKFRLSEKCGFFEKNLIETPKDGKYFKRIANILFISNKTALEAMKRKAEDLGFSARICTTRLKGNARKIGKNIVNKIKKSPPKTVLLFGGETIVKVVKSGKGGRNLEVSLAALRFIAENEKNVLISAVASDGRDNTEFAGGIADCSAKRKARKLNLTPSEYLKNNQSFCFFEKTGDYILTGDTGSNVSDLLIAVKD